MCGDSKQAIYAFAGADTQSIQNLTKEYDLKQLPLNICYRCPENVVKLAKTIVPELEWNVDREDKGEVSVLTQTELYGNIADNDLVICRKNSDVMAIYTKLAFDMKKNVCLVNSDLVNKLNNEIKSCINQYLKYYKLGFNIQVQLQDRLDKYIKSSSTPLTTTQYKDIQTKFIDELIKEKVASKPNDSITIPTLDYLKLCMQDYADNGSYSVDESSLTTMYYDKILYLINKYEMEHPTKSKITLEEFESYLPDLFKYKQENKSSIVISSVHQMKGGESDNVYIYDYPAFPYQFKSLSDEQILQESNLQYVALTRAKKTLSLVLLDNDKYRKANELNAECLALVNNVLKY